MNLLELLMGEAAAAASPDDVRAALMVLVAARLRREQEAERASKHSAIVPQCRAALDKVGRLRDIELPAVALRVEQSWQALDHANKRLWAHQGNRPSTDAYPGEDEIAAYDELTTVLEGEAAKATHAKPGHRSDREHGAVWFICRRDNLFRLFCREAARLFGDALFRQTQLFHLDRMTDIAPFFRRS